MQKSQHQIEEEEKVALTRFKIITPLLTAVEIGDDKSKIGLMKSEVCGQAGISRKTLERWLTRYKENGFDGLKYQGATTSPKRVIPGELVKEAVLLRKEVPSRSVPQIIEILEMEGKAPAGFLKRSTLQDRLREEGYSSAQMKLYQKPVIAARRFVRSERNDLWQSDIKFGPFIKINRKKTQTYFVGLIDDATRYIVHGEFYDSLDQSIVEDSLHKAVLKGGIPDRLFLDNGKQFRNKWMERTCAVLDVKLIFAMPYSPESKGKIERFNQTLDSFLREAALKHPQNLAELNQLFNVWLSECYHNKEHSGIGTTPEIAYASSKKPLKFHTAGIIANAFLHAEQRKVDKSGCISFFGKKYEVGVIYMGRTVDVIYDPNDISVITVEEKYLHTTFQVKELVIGEHSGKRPKLPESMMPVQPMTSRLLDGKKKRYDNRQLSATRAISYAEINKGATPAAFGGTPLKAAFGGTAEGGESNV